MFIWKILTTVRTLANSSCCLHTDRRVTEPEPVLLSELPPTSNLFPHLEPVSVPLTEEMPVVPQLTWMFYNKMGQQSFSLHDLTMREL